MPQPKGGKGSHRGGKGPDGKESSETVGGYAASYVQRYVKCNKERCKKCSAPGGAGHGPYWYKIHRTKEGKVKTKYHGKVPPEQVKTDTKQGSDQ